MKKIFATILSAMFILTLSGTAFAAEKNKLYAPTEQYVFAEIDENGNTVVYGYRVYDFPTAKTDHFTFSGAVNTLWFPNQLAFYEVIGTEFDKKKAGHMQVTLKEDADAYLNGTYANNDKEKRTRFCAIQGVYYDTEDDIYHCIGHGGRYCYDVERSNTDFKGFNKDLLFPDPDNFVYKIDGWYYPNLLALQSAHGDREDYTKIALSTKKNEEETYGVGRWYFDFSVGKYFFRDASLRAEIPEKNLKGELYLTMKLKDPVREYPMPTNK